MKLEDRRDRERQVTEFLIEHAQRNRQDFQALQNKKAAAIAANNRIFLEEYEKIAATIFKCRIAPSSYSLKSDRKPKSRIVNLALGDLHYGAMLDARETPLAYGPKEEARRTAAIVLQAAEYKKQYRNDSRLYVHILGDVIQGQLHDARDGAPMAQQVCAAQYYLVQALSFLAAAYPEVEVFCTPGNHGRNQVRHKERAIVQKWDSLETTIYSGLKIALDHLSNVTVHIERTPYYIAKAFNKKGFYTHGDTVLEVGYPSKSIGVDKAKRTINAMIVNGIDCQLFMVGHVHTGSFVHLGNGALLMTNGCLIPTDNFAQSKALFTSCNGQWIWESVHDHIVGDQRFVEVGEETDRDSALEKIVKPYLGL